MHALHACTTSAIAKLSIPLSCSDAAFKQEFLSPLCQVFPFSKSTSAECSLDPILSQPGLVVLAIPSIDRATSPTQIKDRTFPTRSLRKTIAFSRDA